MRALTLAHVHPVQPLLWACGLYFGIACGGSPSEQTGVMVRIDAEMTTKMNARTVQLRVYRGNDGEWSRVLDLGVPVGDGFDDWPLTLPVVPSDSHSAVFEVQAIALDAAGIELTSTRVLSQCSAARQRPTVVLPTAMSPTRKMLRREPSIEKRRQFGRRSV